MNIKIEKITKETISKRKLKELETDYKNKLFHNSDIITIYDNNNIELGYAIVTPKNNINIEAVFKKNFDSLFEYSREEFKELYLEYKDILNECSYLNYIEMYDKNKGIGAELLNHLKSLYKNIWLYSVIEAEEFYIKNNFEEIGQGDYNYIYIKR